MTPHCSDGSPARPDELRQRPDHARPVAVGDDVGTTDDVDAIAGRNAYARRGPHLYVTTSIQGLSNSRSRPTRRSCLRVAVPEPQRPTGAGRLRPGQRNASGHRLRIIERLPRSVAVYRRTPRVQPDGTRSLARRRSRRGTASATTRVESPPVLKRVRPAHRPRQRTPANCAPQQLGSEPWHTTVPTRAIMVMIITAPGRPRPTNGGPSNDPDPRLRGLLRHRLRRRPWLPRAADDPNWPCPTNQDEAYPGRAAGQGPDLGPLHQVPVPSGPEPERPAVQYSTMFEHLHRGAHPLGRRRNSGKHHVEQAVHDAAGHHLARRDRSGHRGHRADRVPEPLPEQRQRSTPVPVLVATEADPAGDVRATSSRSRRRLLRGRRASRRTQVETGAIVDPSTLTGKVALTDISPEPAAHGGRLRRRAGARSTTSSARNQRAVVVALGSPQAVGGQIARRQPRRRLGRDHRPGRERRRPADRQAAVPEHVRARRRAAANVTLAATPTQAGQLIYASTNDAIWLVLRPTVGTTPKPPVISSGSVTGG